MRVLFTVQPAFSHAAQLIPLAQALQDKGHTAVIGTPEPLAEQLRGFGLDARGVGPRWSVRPGDPIFDRTVGQQQFFGFTQLAQGQTLDETAALARALKPDFIVRDYAEFCGWKIARTLGVPLATHGIMHRLPPPLFDRVAQLAGAPAAQDVLGTFLDVIPPSLRLPWEAPMPGAQAAQPCSFDGSRDDAAPEWLPDAGARRPLVYVTLGTTFLDAPRVWRAVFDAVGALDVDVVCTAPGASLDGVPPNVRVEQYVPQSHLLPRCAAVVCHGGFGTVMGALRHGVPLLILPLAADQPLNASTCAAAGAGINGANGPAIDARGPIVDPATLNAVQIRDALTELLADSRFKTHAQRIAGEIASMPAPDEVAGALVTRLASQPERMPPHGVRA